MDNRAGSRRTSTQIIRRCACSRTYASTPTAILVSRRVDTPEDVARLVEFEQGLAEAGSMAETPPNRYRGDDPGVEKAYEVICRLREYADTVTLFETDIVPLCIP